MVVKTWAELSKEEQGILTTASESGMLMDVLIDWEPGRDWSRRVSQIPRLAEGLIKAVDAGLVEIYQAPSPTEEGSMLFAADGPAVVRDPRNWWSEDGPLIYTELIITADGIATMATCRPGEGYAFRDH